MGQVCGKPKGTLCKDSNTDGMDPPSVRIGAQSYIVSSSPGRGALACRRPCMLGQGGQHPKSRPCGICVKGRPRDKQCLEG